MAAEHGCGFYPSPFGKVWIEAEGDEITIVRIDRAGRFTPTGEHPTKATDEAARQLAAYLAGDLKDFTLQLRPAGTAFQKKAWAELCRIPYGETRTYRDIAEAIDCPKGYRAVGLANNRNPIMIFIPCHRVVGADGSLTGYAGGTDIKEHLLALEKKA